MTRKTFFRIIFGILVVVFFGSIYVYFFALAPQNNIGGVVIEAPSSTSQVPYTPPPPPKSDTIVLGTPQGGVTVKNFYSDAAYTDSEGNVFIRSNDTYHFIYFPRDSSFLFTIQTTPVLEVKKTIEADLLKILNISQGDACKLKIGVRVPNSVDPSYVGQDLGLSFCAGNVQSNQ